MINIRTLKKMGNDDGMTLKKGKKVCYKTGYQVAVGGKITNDMREALRMIKEYDGNCGIWFYEDMWYIDQVIHLNTTKKEALRIGLEYKQISVFQWRSMKSIDCSTGKPCTATA